MKKNDDKKVSIDYLQFLNYPCQNEENKKWFFTYLDPVSEENKRVEDRFKIKLFQLYNKKKEELIKLQKKREVKIETTTKIDKAKKKAGKFKVHKDSATYNKLISKEINTKALELKIQGYDKEAIEAQLIETYKISLSTARDSIKWCYQELVKDVDEDFIRITVLNHSKAYDDIYRKMIELGAPKLAMRALKIKETLNGLGTDIFEIQVNNVFEDQKDLVNYGLKKLTEDEQKEFIEIISRVSAISEQKQLK